ncbi:hypothetical protein [Paraliomyxa miuraensis]|uniref:hypothetical protein n=1 Tax=Paraliomyxa miuraensis TaxID=376150 RepID=UPI00225C2BE9|nr:hypothetical protein [Paraliomyxa miuraensis]MCX4243279.1 hypothetical protein [Paraliomyxa miuraensis]
MKRVSIFAFAILGGATIGAISSHSSSEPAITTRSLAEAEDHWKIVTLTNDMARLREQLEQGDRSAHHAAEDETRDDEPELAEIIARERETAERRAAVLTAAVHGEVVDSDWAPAVELQIADGLAALGPQGARLLSVSCKTTLCMAEIEHPPGSDAEHVSWLRVFGLSRGFFVHHEPAPGSGARTVAYLARDGFSLPRADPAAAAG